VADGIVVGVDVGFGPPPVSCPHPGALGLLQPGFAHTKGPWSPGTNPNAHSQHTSPPPHDQQPPQPC
jgi:hypothetical protein